MLFTFLKRVSAEKHRVDARPSNRDRRLLTLIIHFKFHSGVPSPVLMTPVK